MKFEKKKKKDFYNQFLKKNKYIEKRFSLNNARFIFLS